jgi:hypothetical protein
MVSQQDTVPTLDKPTNIMKRYATAVWAVAVRNEQNIKQLNWNHTVHRRPNEKNNVLSTDNAHIL